LGVRGAVADGCFGVGAEEGDDEDGGEDFDRAKGFGETQPVAGREGGRGGRAWFVYAGFSILCLDLSSSCCGVRVLC
jgi:hypothetical protein